MMCKIDPTFEVSRTLFDCEQKNKKPRPAPPVMMMLAVMFFFFLHGPLL